jgi:L-aminopeptidase/D-esterase-like protein
MFAAATGVRPVAAGDDLTELLHLATLVMARAIARGIYAATALDAPNAQLAWRDRWTINRCLPPVQSS